jgi:23S rRNA-/tRNA-specific pseudouridylate synthase
MTPNEAPAGDAARTAVVPDEAAGRRFDAVVADLFPEFSRSRLSEWIKSGDLLLDGRLVRGRDPVRGGESVALTVVLEVQTHAVAEDIPLDILYEDPAVFVLDKPAGLVVHPGAGNPAGTLVNALLHRDPALAALPRAGIVHRLDKDTSGVMVVARTLPAHTALVEQLSARGVHRQYLAVGRRRAGLGGTANARSTATRATASAWRARRRPRSHHALPPARTLPRAHRARMPPGNRAHAPDPRAHGAPQASDRRRSAVRRPAEAAARRDAELIEALRRLQAPGAACRDAGVRASDQRRTDPLHRARAGGPAPIDGRAARRPARRATGRGDERSGGGGRGRDARGLAGAGRVCRPSPPCGMARGRLGRALRHVQSRAAQRRRALRWSKAIARN